MEDVLVPIVVVGMLFIGMPWLIFHYITKWKQAPKITDEDERLLDELHLLARRLEERIVTVERIVAAPNIDVRLRAEVLACAGDTHLQSLTVGDRDSGARETVPADWLFIFIGASPHTEWLGAAVARDAQGFVVTGPDLSTPAGSGRWPLPRAPLALETSLPGVFAAGDVRLDSMKRVASAVGDGAMSVYLVHRYLGLS